MKVNNKVLFEPNLDIVTSTRISIYTIHKEKTKVKLAECFCKILKKINLLSES